MPINTSCEHCKKPLRQPPSQFKKFKRHYCNAKCQGKWLSIHKRGSNNPNFKGGWIQQGYKFINDGKKQISEHRYIIEKLLKRKLHKNEHVHHINGDKLDNQIENLQVLTDSEHHRHHSKIMWQTRKRLPTKNIIKLYNQGFSTHAIGKKLHLHQGSVWIFLKSSNLKTNYLPGSNQNKLSLRHQRNF